MLCILVKIEIFLNEIMTKTIPIIFSVLILSLTPFAFADSTRDSNLEFAGSLEETLGHFWALEQNLDENNSELALIHATHPISELYDTMSGYLQNNPEFDQKLETTLMELKDKASTDVDINDAKAAIDSAKEVIEEARDIVVASDLSEEPEFQLQLINTLLETAKVEYHEAVTDGQITEMAEFQDGSAFVWRSQQIFVGFESIMNAEDYQRITGLFDNVWSDFDNLSSPTDMEVSIDAIISEFEEQSGYSSEESSHSEESEIKAHKESEKKGSNASEMALSKMSPRAQMKHGIASGDVVCRDGFELVMKNSDNSAACINSHSVEKLIQRGWASYF